VTIRQINVAAGVTFLTNVQSRLLISVFVHYNSYGLESCNCNNMFNLDSEKSLFKKEYPTFLEL